MLKQTILAATLIIPSISCLASELNGVVITGLNINRGFNQVFVGTSTPPTAQNRIACHTDTNWNFTFTFTTDVDKAVYASLLAAQAAGKTVNIVGKNACTTTGYMAIEDISFVTFSN